MKDLFEHYTLLPKHVQLLIEYWEQKEWNDMQEAEAQFKAVGYTFDYGLDMSPHSLKKIDQKYVKACKVCGSGSVYGTSRSYWDYKSQSWKFSEHLIDEFYCDDCEAHVEIEDHLWDSQLEDQKEWKL